MIRPCATLATAVVLCHWCSCSCCCQYQRPAASHPQLVLSVSSALAQLIAALRLIWQRDLGSITSTTVDESTLQLRIRLRSFSSPALLHQEAFASVEPMSVPTETSSRPLLCTHNLHCPIIMAESFAQPVGRVFAIVFDASSPLLLPLLALRSSSFALPLVTSIMFISFPTLISTAFATLLFFFILLRWSQFFRSSLILCSRSSSFLLPSLHWSPQ